jgi:protein-S-isoprenylcysteine O-methyltransferase Ste14
MSAERTTADPRPPSDVSGWVGLVGLVVLFAWIWICREWAAVVDLFALPGPRAPLSGPYAALMAMLFTGGAMAAWSLLVDQVHRRPSTGIDWSLRRPFAATRDVSITKLAGLWATFALIGVLYCVARWYWRGQYLFAMEVIAAAAVPLFVLSVPYVLWLDRYLVNPRDGAWHFGAMLIGREPYDRTEVAHHLRAWGVKAFFTAFMVSILPGGFAHIVSYDFAGFFDQPVRFAALLIELLFVIDVQIGTVGYLLTMKPLDAHIRTANPYLAGWLAALICYPPFILMGSGGPLDYHQATSDWAYWMEGREALLWVWGALLVFLTAVYAWATVAFGIRFSNLTHRGVLTGGPYRFTKHPAYLSKNLFWWCATLPFLATSGSWTDAIRNTALMALVGGVYYWRAKTEERHLGEADPKYRAYSAWMDRNAPITRGLKRAARLFAPRGPRLQPAE